MTKTSWESIVQWLFPEYSEYLYRHFLLRHQNSIHLCTKPSWNTPLYTVVHVVSSKNEDISLHSSAISPDPTLVTFPDRIFHARWENGSGLLPTVNLEILATKNI